MEHRPNDVRDEDSMSRDDPSEDALYGQKFARVVSKYKTRAGVMYFKIREVRRWSDKGINADSAEVADINCAAVPAFATETQ